MTDSAPLEKLCEARRWREAEFACKELLTADPGQPAALFLRKPRLVSIVALALLLAGCASGATPGGMTVQVAPGSITADTSPAHAAVAIGSVSGGGETNPLWMSDVSPKDFRQALEQSLQVYGVLASGAPRYTLDVQLLELDRPFLGLDMTVTAKVHYTLTSSADKSVKLDRTLVTGYTATFGDQFLGQERLRVANEGTMRESIKAIVAEIMEALRSPGTLSANVANPGISASPG